ncbi:MULTISPECIES: MarR family winged helix-turn-helix transcriptional regulator [Actinoalloteichus]|nr:MarR family winged helix-turn-helix transcriptional regulator [Actinoalloteichus caeruleus]
MNPTRMDGSTMAVNGPERLGTGADGTRGAAADSVERELTILFRRAKQSTARLASQIHVELEPAAYGTLSMIAERGPVRGTDVVDLLNLDKSTISRQLSKLVELRLIERVPDPVDGRARRVQLTDLGSRRLREVRERRRERLDEQLAEWPTSDLTELARLLNRLNEAF